nr:immunoglobulin light chain junction region [Macaca mulatta]MOV80566.1 immunoglobulin light chain junction region [Macaca mulatta]MOV86469.1 immunoglobulin light chain junction region [Macaca mulatta]
CQQCDSDSLTF